MNDESDLAARFEAERPHLRRLAYRMLGSGGEAEDAVQESWLRLCRAGVGEIGSLTGWLTTVVTRIAIDMLRARAARRETVIDRDDRGESGLGDDPIDPTDLEAETLLADQVGAALLVVLHTLAPAERIAFVLHDMFGLSFGEIAPMVGRSPAAARQLASRARRRVRGSSEVPNADLSRKRAVVAAYAAAARGGDFNALLLLLDPEIVLRLEMPDGRMQEIRGAADVAKSALLGARESARFAEVALVNGVPGIVVAPLGRLRTVLDFTLRDDRIVEIAVISRPARLRQLVLAVPDDRGRLAAD